MPDSPQPPRERAMTTKPNKLTPDQAVAVRAWLEIAWPDIERRRLSRDAAASLCSATEGFRVTAANVVSACRRLGKTWPSDSTADQRLGYRIHLLKRALGHMYRTVGIDPPDADVARLLDLRWPAGESAEDAEADEPTDPDFLVEHPISSTARRT